MDSVSTYSLANLAWLTVQAVPLVVWPSLISTLLRVDSPASQAGSPQYSVANAALEQYFARCLGLSQLALAGLLLVQSGALPLDSMVETPSSPTPSASAVILISSLYHAAAASYAYTRYHATGQLAYLFGCLGGSVLAAFGLWALMFGGEKNRRVSRRTGADKSTSGWPFRNAEADKKRR